MVQLGWSDPSIGMYAKDGHDGMIPMLGWYDPDGQMVQLGWSDPSIPMLGFEHPTDKNHGFLTVTSSVQDHGLV
jgi:hypothetical protein